MSLWKIGADDVSEETQAFKDKLASKGMVSRHERHPRLTQGIDAQIAAQRDRLTKQDTDLQQLRDTLNETIHKVR